MVGPRVERVLGAYDSQREAKDAHIIIYTAQTVSDILSHLPMVEFTET